MHRQSLLEMLTRYLSQYPDEAKIVDQIRQFVAGSPDCFERTCRPGHVTGSAWVLSHDRSRCLLVHHRKLERWLQPGGHADGDGNLAEVAQREVREETGLTDWEPVQTANHRTPLDVDIHRIPARLTPTGQIVEDAHHHYDIRFLILAAANQKLVLSEESHDLRWFTRTEVLEVTHEESVLRMLRKAGPKG